MKDTIEEADLIKVPNQEPPEGENFYTPTRLKKSSGAAIVSLTPEQAKRKIALLSRFITGRWGSESPALYESIDQEATEAYEAFIDPYVLNDLPIPEYQPKQKTAAMAPQGTKVCKTCHREKPLLEFYSHPKTKDGRRPTCKACMVSEAQGRRRTVANT